MSTTPSVSHSSDSDEDIDIETESPKRVKVSTVPVSHGLLDGNQVNEVLSPRGVQIVEFGTTL